MKMKKVIGVLALLSCFSTSFAQGAAVSKTFEQALADFGGKEVQTLLEKGGVITPSVLGNYFLVPSQAITDFMMPSVVLAPMPQEMSSMRTSVLRRLQQQISLFRTKGVSQPMLAPEFKVQQVRPAPSLDALIKYSKAEGEGDMEEFQQKNNITYERYFTPLLKTLYSQAYFHGRGGIGNNTWDFLQRRPFVNYYEGNEGSVMAVQSVEHATSRFSPRAVPSINVFYKVPKQDSLWGFEENKFEDMLIPDLTTGKFISYNQSIAPVWKHILTTFPKKTEIAFRNSRASGSITFNGKIFNLKDTLVFSNGNGTGVLLDKTQVSINVSEVIKDALDYGYKFYLQPYGKAIQLDEKVSKIINVHSIYPSYVLYVAPNQGGRLFKIENIKDLSSQVTPQQ